MKILFDQGTPAPLRYSLNDHYVATAYEQGWSNFQNGDLIHIAQLNGFELLITTDKNLKYQQNLGFRKISILVLPTTSWPKISQYQELIVKEIEFLKLGDYLELAFN